jgi:hypothetical protein
MEVINAVLAVPVDDGFTWSEVSGEILNHPDLPSPGVRAHCSFTLGKMKGTVHIDLASGDKAEGTVTILPRLQYKGEPLFPEPLSLKAYTPEETFAEKVYIAQSKGAQNTRMKDYYDLYRLCDHNLEAAKVRDCLERTYLERGLTRKPELSFSEAELERLETYWKHFLSRHSLEDAPNSIVEVIGKLSGFLGDLYGKGS